uniref:Uncharacterized protein n=1 Tax=Lepeophtheirus salmonis TaxID=72036 RepID=A0A0K2U476_LEPSM
MHIFHSISYYFRTMPLNISLGLITCSVRIHIQ